MGLFLSKKDVEKIVEKVIRDELAPLLKEIRENEALARTRHLQVTAKLNTAIEHLQSIMKTEAQVTAELIALKEQSMKIAKEQGDRSDALNARIKELEDLIRDGGNVSPELEAALADLKAAQQSLDDSIPDVAPPAPHNPA